MKFKKLKVKAPILVSSIGLPLLNEDIEGKKDEHGNLEIEEGEYSVTGTIEASIMPNRHAVLCNVYGCNKWYCYIWVTEVEAI